jgi:hypothetical protein
MYDRHRTVKPRTIAAVPAGADTVRCVIESSYRPCVLALR